MPATRQPDFVLRSIQVIFDGSIELFFGVYGAVGESAVDKTNVATN